MKRHLEFKYGVFKGFKEYISEAIRVRTRAFGPQVGKYNLEFSKYI